MNKQRLRLGVAVGLVWVAAGCVAQASDAPAVEIAADLAAVGGGIRLDRTAALYGDLVAERYVLENGLVLVYLRDPSAPVFSIQTWVRTGSRHETPGRTGMAHLFEHLMFRATSNHPDGEYDRIFEELGCQTNADTWTDRTRYYEDLPRQHLDIACELEADRLVNLVLDGETFADELEVVKNERRQSVEDDPWGKLDEVFTSSLFGREHPYGWPTLGWMKDLEGMTVESARDFYHTFYAPNGVTLVLAGDLERRAVLESVQRHYGPLEPSKLPARHDPAPPVKAALASTEIELEFTSERLMLGWIAPPIVDPDHLAVELVVRILFDGETSRWWRRIVRDDPIASEVSGWVFPFTAAGGVQLSATMLPSERASDALAAAEAILDEVRSGAAPITPDELDGARRRLEIAALDPLSTAHGKAELLGESEVVMGDLGAGKARIDAIPALTLKDCARVIGRVFQPAARTVVIAHPTAAVASETPPPAASHEPGVLPGPGGSLVLVEEDPSLPLVEVAIVLRDGAAADPPGLAGLEAFAADALVLGAGDMTRQQIEARLLALGSSFDATTSRDSTTWTGTVLARDLPAWMDLAATLLTSPTFPVSEITKLRARYLSDLETLQEDDRDLATVTFDAGLFGESGYGLPVGGMPVSLRAIQRDDLVAWHAGLSGGDLVFSASGDVSLAEFAELVEMEFGSLPVGDPRHPGAPHESELLPAGLSVVLVDKPDRTQSRWLLGTVAPGWPQGPFEALDLASTAFGGTFKARLNDELRVKEGWTYGAYAWHAPMRTLGSFQISSATAADVTVPAIRRTLEMLDEWLAQGLSAVEISAARSYMENARPFEIDTAAKRLRERVMRLLLGLPPDHHERILERLTAVDAGDVTAALSQLGECLSTRLLVVVGTASELEDGLAGLPGVSRMIVLPQTHLGAIHW